MEPGGDPASPCEPGPGNAPISDQDYRCSLGVGLQRTVDGARRLRHQLGLRPYRVRLIWAQRDSRERYQVVRELELTPVRVEAIEDLGYDLEIAGRQTSGSLSLSEISPAQVQEYQLLGKWDGGEDPPDDVEFFYEVERISRCAGEVAVRPGRFTPVGRPGLDAEAYQWVVELAAQHNPRGPEGQYPDRDGAFRPARGAPARSGRPRFRR